MTFKGQKNIYLCRSCGRGHVSIDVDDGTTPYITSCLNCGEEAYSLLYRCPQPLLTAVPATQEWYRPGAAELATLKPHTQQHVRMGGLISRLAVGKAGDA